MNPRKTHVVLCLGVVPGEIEQALAARALAAESCRDAYDLATTLMHGHAFVSAIHIASEALSPRVVSLIRLVRTRDAGVPVWIGPGARRSTMLAALAALGAVPAEQALGVVQPVPEASPAVTTPPERAPEKAVVDRPSRRVPPPALPTDRPSRRGDDSAITVRTPTRATADNVASDNTLVSSKGIEDDSSSRYDAITGQTLLTDDELRALLEPSDDSTQV